MDSYWESISDDASNMVNIDLPMTPEPVYVLGQKYSALYDREECLSDIQSRIWITYRRGFPPIGGFGFTSDAGWGCMHRCGQMMLAQTLIQVFLGRDWRWKHKPSKNHNAPTPAHSSQQNSLQTNTTANNLTINNNLQSTTANQHPEKAAAIYQKILSLFLDSRNSLYSIHLISSMGENEGKQIGKWFGPNTVAQVLKKLTNYDKWSRLQIHVAMEDGVIINELIDLCREKTTRINLVEPPTNSTNKNWSQLNRSTNCTIADKTTTSKSNNQSSDSNVAGTNHVIDLSDNADHSGKLYRDIDEESVEVIVANGDGDGDEYQTGDRDEKESTQKKSSNHTQSDAAPHQKQQHDNVTIEIGWKPLLLIIPLRLGLSELNSCYIPALKKIFSLPQTVGILGGRPSHALWIIGVVGDELLYLDPHFTQPTVFPLNFVHVASPTPSSNATTSFSSSNTLNTANRDEDESSRKNFSSSFSTTSTTFKSESVSTCNWVEDSSYHNDNAGRMHISKLDPSIALGFCITSQQSLLELCHRLKQEVLDPEGMHPLFEIHQKRTRMMPPKSLMTQVLVETAGEDSQDEEFEII